MKLQLLRNATLVLSAAGKTLLIDPMLGRMGAYEPFRNTSGNKRNPTVELPIDDKDLPNLISTVDAVLLTHIHSDHWDARAKELLPKTIDIFCQPSDVMHIQTDGFLNAKAIEDTTEYGEISIARTRGRHGTGEIGERMGSVSGYVIYTDTYRLYIAGDTIWCNEVQQAITIHKPTHIVVNGGGARFITGDPIVMNIPDILQLCSFAPDIPKYVIHLEAVNHASETRANLKTALSNAGITNCHIPDDGGWLL